MPIYHSNFTFFQLLVSKFFTVKQSFIMHQRSKAIDKPDRMAAAFETLICDGHKTPFLSSERLLSLNRTSERWQRLLATQKRL